MEDGTISRTVNLELSLRWSKIKNTLREEGSKQNTENETVVAGWGQFVAHQMSP